MADTPVPRPSEAPSCPFAVGQRIHERSPTVFYSEFGEGLRLELDPTRPDAIVTALTERGFSYEYLTPVPFGRAAWGQMMTGGEYFPEGYQYWVAVKDTTL